MVSSEKGEGDEVRRPGTGDADDEDDSPGEPVPRVWDRPDDQHDPPSQRPEDTHEEERRRRRAG
jgi:hypothetical protein